MSISEKIPFEQCYENYQPLIYSLIKRWNLVHNREEYIQIGMIALYEAWAKFDPEMGQFAAFAKSYVYGRIKDALRSEERWSKKHSSTDPYTITKLSPAVDSHDEEFIAVRDLLAKTPFSTGEQRWIEGTILYQLKQREIADKYGVSVNTVKTWRTNALKKLKKHNKRSFS